ncbi:MAG: polysaccharide pyruvyl transferase family protein, partial [Ignavibacterium sp.]
MHDTPIIDSQASLLHIDLSINGLKTGDNDRSKFAYYLMVNSNNSIYVDDYLEILNSKGLSDILFILDLEWISKMLCEATTLDASKKIFHLIGVYQKLTKAARDYRVKRKYYDLICNLLIIIHNPRSSKSDIQLQLVELKKVVRFYPQQEVGNVKNMAVRFLRTFVIRTYFEYLISVVKNKVEFKIWVNRKSISSFSLIRPAKSNTPDQWSSAIITGWYGTETAGDKAILAELVHILKLYNPNIKLYITSIDAAVSVQTNLELEMADVTIIMLRDAKALQIIKNVDAIIFGGGPLMDSSQLKYIRDLFLEAGKTGIARIIFGCGVGPIHTDAALKYIREILTNTTSGFFRDIESAEYAKTIVPGLNLPVACDPAVGH